MSNVKLILKLKKKNFVPIVGHAKELQILVLIPATLATDLPFAGAGWRCEEGIDV